MSENWSDGGADTRWPGHVGHRIRTRRGALNLTLPEVATRAGVSLAYLGLLEAGGLPEPGWESLRRVAAFLDDTRLVQWLDWIGTRPPTPPA